MRNKGRGTHERYALIRVGLNATKLVLLVLAYPVRLAVRQWRRQRRLDRVRSYIRGEDD